MFSFLGRSSARARRSRPRPAPGIILARNPPPRFPRRRILSCPPVSLGSAARGLGRGGDTAAERHAPGRQCAGVSVVHGVVARRAQADQIPRRPGQLRPVLCGPGVMHHRGVDRQAVAATLPALVAIPPQGSTTCGRPALRLVIHGPRPWRSAPGLSPPADEKSAWATTPPLGLV